MPISFHMTRKAATWKRPCSRTASDGSASPSSGCHQVCSASSIAYSGSRPGARTESGEFYVQRLEKLEEIASAFKGVKKCYAMQAGREVRVIVDPGETSDNDAMILARQIAGKVSAELEFPGQIRVVAIREQRFVEYAR